MSDLFGTPEPTAAFSPDGAYRYNLTRWWGADDEPCATFVMLNPSTADATADDPTIRRCIGYARREGCAGLRVVNLYALRATHPTALWLVADPVGPENDEWLTAAAREARKTDSPLIAAWGMNATPERTREVLALPGFDRLTCLGITKGGAPRHPLYLPANAPLREYAA